jgi:hypothetical protein
MNTGSAPQIRNGVTRIQRWLLEQLTENPRDWCHFSMKIFMTISKELDISFCLIWEWEDGVQAFKRADISEASYTFLSGLSC